MPSFDALTARIKKLQGKGTNSKRSFKKMLSQFGKALREFIEHDTQFKPDTKGKNQGKSSQANAGKAQNQIKGLYDLVNSISTNVGAKSLRDVGKAYATSAAMERARADKEVKDPDDQDAASEDYVSAAVNEYRAALSFYALGQMNDPNRDYSTQEVIDGELNYAARLVQAAKDLASAASCEDPEDVTEIMAELMVSANMFKAAKAALDDLSQGCMKKGVNLDQKTKDNIKDLGNEADTGSTDSEDKLNTHLYK
jgi:hypothetical protein